MIRVSRLRGPSIVLLSLAVAIALCGVVVRQGLTVSPSWPPRWGGANTNAVYVDVAGKLTAARRDIDRAVAAGREPDDLALVIGNSSMWAALDLEHLDVDDHWKWLGLPAYAIRLSEMMPFVDLSDAAGLKPKAVVVVVNPFMLVSPPGDLAEFRDFDLRTLRKEWGRRHTAQVLNELENLGEILWTRNFPQRARVAWHTRRDLFFAQLALFRRLGHGLEVVTNPVKDPWTMPLSEYNLDAAERLRLGNPGRDDDYMMSLVRESGGLDPAIYTPESHGLSELVRVAREVRARGGELFIVDVALTTRLRGVVPKTADESLKTALKNAFGDRPPPLIDLRAAIDESGFTDLVHLNREGRARFTEKLAAELRPRFESLKRSEATSKAQTSQGK